MTSQMRLMETQEEYRRTQDPSILGRMLEPHLLPLIARRYIQSFSRRVLKTQLPSQEVTDAALDCSLRIIAHIEQGRYVGKSFYRKMYWTVSNYYRDRRTSLEREADIVLRLDGGRAYDPVPVQSPLLYEDHADSGWSLRTTRRHRAGNSSRESPAAVGKRREAEP
ncbi:MAG TPA: hypothetical protein VLH39_01180 [Magnetospirillaceae bacterium]|nr:hypothetical protein [Magnetospirillaceae bacterium]